MRAVLSRFEGTDLAAAFHFPFWGFLRNPHSLPRASCAILFRSPSLKQAWTRYLGKVLRREGDSNPRNPFGVYTLSRRASSTTRASLLNSQTGTLHLLTRKGTKKNSYMHNKLAFFSIFSQFYNKKPFGTLSCHLIYMLYRAIIYLRQALHYIPHPSALIAFPTIRNWCHIRSVCLQYQ